MLTRPLSKSCPSSLLPCHLQPPSPSAFSTVLLLWLNGRSHRIWCATLLNDNIDLHMSSLGTLVPEGHWRVFYVTRSQVYWDLTQNVAFYWYFDLISHMQRHKHTQHTQGPVDWHTHMNIYLHHLLCAYSSCLYYIKWLNE